MSSRTIRRACCGMYGAMPMVGAPEMHRMKATITGAMVRKGVCQVVCCTEHSPFRWPLGRCALQVCLHVRVKMRKPCHTTLDTCLEVPDPALAVRARQQSSNCLTLFTKLNNLAGIDLYVQRIHNRPEKNELGDKSFCSGDKLNINTDHPTTVVWGALHELSVVCSSFKSLCQVQKNVLHDIKFRCQRNCVIISHPCKEFLLMHSMKLCKAFVQVQRALLHGFLVQVDAQVANLVMIVPHLDLFIFRWLVS
mmetsp:Transcript_40013/g.62454  ORF Transcript_40013/g.62454 Transcript_40013/m.62454 type:complete len:251 (-) Transcript_40013:416-1168(-)